MKEISAVEEYIFEFIDKIRSLFVPEQWNNIFMDYSKNEIFALIFVYRKGTATMSQIAEYLSIPLNTLTGVIGRLEKRGVLKRQRDTIDKRVVTVSISPTGIEFITNSLNIISQYYNMLWDSISKEEKKLLLKLIDNFINLINQELPTKADIGNQKARVRKITIE
ncbi:MAG TPA: MarR family transcriptional regulator [Defluviitaleaceae bacterium]|jgi:DNA-binding MarR family transcriptional regulator|nr:MarR family transcriptional regulator [Defluviitaleaceae bacterium]